MLAPVQAGVKRVCKSRRVINSQWEIFDPVLSIVFRKKSFDCTADWGGICGGVYYRVHGAKKDPGVMAALSNNI